MQSRQSGNAGRLVSNKKNKGEKTKLKLATKIAALACVVAAFTGSVVKAGDDTTTTTDGKKSVITQQAAPYKWWAASITAEWDSLYMYRGVNELRFNGVNGSKQSYGSSIYSTTVNLSFMPTPNDTISLSSWTGVGFTNSVYKEEDLTATYTHTFGNLALSFGYEFYLLMPSPDVLFQNELQWKIAYTFQVNSIFSITPSLAYYFDVGPNWDGGMKYSGGVPQSSSYLYPRIDFNIAAYKDIIALNPFVGLGINFRYNAKVNSSPAGYTYYNGVNNLELGLNVPIKVNSVISLNVYGEYSYQFYGLVGTEPSTFWGGGSVTFSF
jgi:hypothetical protein